MPSHIDEFDEFESSAPRPVDDRLVEQGDLQQLGEGQGAVRASRRPSSVRSDQAEAGQSLDRRTLAIVVASGLAVIALIVFLVIRALSGPVPNSQQADGPVVEVEQTQAPADGSIAYRGSTYELVESVEGYALAETRADGSGSPTILGELDGIPAGLVLYDGAVIVPENLADGTWDVMAYTIGSGWSKIQDQSGSTYGGSGTIGEVTLDGSTLRLSVDGTLVDIPLVW